MKIDMESGQITQLYDTQLFCFDCHRSVPCFNACCRDLNQFLTPYDIVRLKNHFGLSSSDFLRRYTTRHIGPQTGLPVITITPADRFSRICPFVTPSGCSIYENRPSSCRMYPLIRVVRRSREDGGKTIQYALIEEKHCRGFEQVRELTVQEWMKGQGLAAYNEYNDLMMDIIGLKNQYMPGPLDETTQQLFYTLCYDVDALKEKGGLSGPESIEVFDNIKQNDEALLRFAMRYLEKFFQAQQSG